MDLFAEMNTPTVVCREKDGRWVPYVENTDSAGNTRYEVACDCGTGRFSGWNFEAVINHHRGYARKSGAVRAWKKQYSF